MEEIWYYFNEMRIFYDYVLHQYLENDDYQEDISNLWTHFQYIKYNKYKLKCALHIIAKISDNHFRSANLWYKIEQLILSLRDNIKCYLSEEETFTVFLKSKKILLFLFQEKIITPQYYMYDIFNFKKYGDEEMSIYFLKEFQPFFPESFHDQSKQTCEDQSFLNKRQIGENPNDLCELIRNDSINEFVSYVNTKNVSIDSKVEISVYETNLYLIKNKPNLIEYSAFFGSIQVFKYLYQLKASITPSLLLYAIHGNNYNIINFIENEIELTNEDYYNCYIESVKCHHNELARYYYDKCTDIISNEKIIKILLKYYNFELISNYDDINIYDLMYYFCQYDYYIPTQELLNFINLTKKILKNKFYLLISIQKRNIDIVKLLVNHPKIDINQKCPVKTNNDEKITIENYALVTAAKNNCNEIFQFLLNQPNIDINKNMRIKKYFDSISFEIPALFYAVSNKNIEMIQSLVNRKEIKINSLIYCDAFSDVNRKIIYSEIVQILLHHPKIDVNIISTKIKDEKIYTNTALSQAIKDNQIDIIKILLDSKKIDVNSKTIVIDNNTKVKMTPLGLAIEAQNIDAINLLLLHPKIDLNKQCIIWKEQSDTETKEKRTPLQIAIENKNIDIVKILLNNEKTNVNATFDSYIIKYHLKTEKAIPLIALLLLIACFIYAIYTGDWTYSSLACTLTNLLDTVFNFVFF